MNRHATRIPAEFRPETRFEVHQIATVPFRATLEDEFERLKHRLLAERLAETPPELTAPVRRAANEAAALAWVTFYPLLVFPTLFEEKTAAAIRHARRQQRIYDQTRELAPA